VELFKKNPHVLEKYQNKFQYILVDEYQDTNHAQYLLTKMLSKKWNNICVVGDFSQSIYSFRGADFLNLAKFKEDFKNTKTFSLSKIIDQLKKFWMQQQRLSQRIILIRF